jgi:hypothetical protein
MALVRMVKKSLTGSRHGAAPFFFSFDKKLENGFRLKTQSGSLTSAARM